MINIRIQFIIREISLSGRTFKVKYPKLALRKGQLEIIIIFNVSLLQLLTANFQLFKLCQSEMSKQQNLLLTSGIHQILYYFSDLKTEYENGYINLKIKCIR
jgi:hypothetical protein